MKSRRSRCQGRTAIVAGALGAMWAAAGAWEGPGQDMRSAWGEPRTWRHELRMIPLPARPTRSASEHESFALSLEVAPGARYAKVSEIPGRPTRDEGEPGSFGDSLAISGAANVLLVGRPYEIRPTCGALFGGAHLYSLHDRTKWTLNKRLYPPMCESGNQFGFAVALAGDGKSALVSRVDEGAESCPNCGSVYAFGIIQRPDGSKEWGVTNRIPAPEPLPFGGFGYEIAMSEDGLSAVIGQFVYEKRAGLWVMVQKLRTSDGVFRPDSSLSLARDGRTLIVGVASDVPCPNPRDFTSCGAAYLFKKDALGKWIQKRRFTRPSKGSFAFFGAVTVLSGDGETAVVTSPGAGCSVGIEVCGFAFVYENRSNTGWKLVATVKNLDQNESSFFGFSAAITEDGNRILVGASPQSISVFHRSSNGSWIGRQHIRSEIGDGLGASVAIDPTGASAFFGIPATVTCQAGRCFGRVDAYSVPK